MPYIGFMSIATPSEYLTEVQQFRQQRAQMLAQENSWLALAGLFWLEPGSNSIGSDPTSVVLLPPNAPEHLGKLTLEGHTLQLKALEPVQVDGNPQVEATLHSDASGKPSRVTLDNLSFILIRRGDKYGVRLWDNQSLARLSFRGIDWFPAREEYRIEAGLIEDPQTLEIINILGMVNPTQSPGHVEFELGGQTHRLVAQSSKPQEYLFFNFKDTTNGQSTYGAGRFLTTGGVKDGKVMLDFNYATNPYCAYTAYATCPLAPAENRLPIAIEAGEKQFNG